MKKKTFKKLLSVCTIVAVAFCFTVTPISQVITGDYDSGYAYAAKKKTSSKSSSSKSKSSKSSSSKSSKSKSSSSKSKGSTSATKDYTVANKTNSQGMKSPAGATYSDLVKKYGKGNVIVGADGYLHASSKGPGQAASYDGGAQHTPVTKDYLQKNDNKGAYAPTSSLPPGKGEVYMVGTNPNADRDLANGLKAIGYTFKSDPPTQKEIVEKIGQWKADSGNSNTYASTIGASNVQTLLDAATGSNKTTSGGGGGGTYRPYYPDPGENNPELEKATCSLVHAKITSTPKDGKAYFDTEILTFEVQYRCGNTNNYDSSNLLKEVRIGNNVYSVQTPVIGSNTITYTGSIFLTDLNAGTHTLEYISNEDNKIGSDDFKVQKAGAVLPGGNGENEATGSGADDYNLISHTKKWNGNRKDFNSKSSNDRAYNVFWIGEELISTLRYNMPEDADAALKAKVYATKAELRKDTKSGTLMHTFALDAPSKVSGKDGYTHEQRVKLLEGLSDTAKKTLLNNIKSGTYWIVLKNAAGEEIASCKIVFDNTIEYYAFHRTTSVQTNNRLFSGNL